MLTPQEFAEKQNRRLKAALEDIRTGVSRVDVAPTQLAAKKKEKMKTKLNEAIDKGKWERNLQKVTLQEWQEKIINKGIPRISGGIDAARAKVEDFARQFLPHVEAGVKKIQTMPDLTLEDSIQRAAAMIRHNASFQKQ